MILEQDHSYEPLEDVGAVRIKVVGIGGGGVNVIRRMAGTAVPGVGLLCANTDVDSLQMASSVETMHIGERATKGLGTGGNPLIGRRAADEAQEQLRSYLHGADLVFIAAGMGGGTGTGAAPVVAAIAREAGAVTIGVVTVPFGFEGSRRMAVAQAGLEPLRESIDTLVVVGNERLVGLVNRNTSVEDAFAMADQVMVQAILAVSRTINLPAQINVDFADIRAVIENGGTGLMAIGHASGERRILKAAQAAMANPLLDIGVEGAKSLLFVVSGGPDITLNEMSEAGSYISGFADQDAQIFFGMHADEETEDTEVELILIATHLPDRAGGEEDPEPEELARLRNTIPIFEADAELPSFLQRGWQRQEGIPGEPSDTWTNEHPHSAS